MKLIQKISAICALSGLIATLHTSTTHAAISRDDVSSILANIYGLATTDDPLCKTGWVVNFASTTPQLVDMTQEPNIGSGPVASPIKCVALFLKNSVAVSWASGSYTSTSSNLSDSVCNSGGTVNVKVCTNTTATVSSDLSSKLSGHSLSLTTTCPASPTGSEIVPIYLSSASGCYGNTNIDGSTCISNGSTTTNTFRAPGFQGDTASGIKISAPPASGRFKMVIDFDKSVGNQSGSCASLAPPAFSFRAVTN